MIRTIRSEFIKLRTIRSNWVAVAVAIGFPVVVFGLWVRFADYRGLDAPAGLEVQVLVGFAIVTAMVLGALSAVSITGEHTHGTIRPTYAATPNRLKVLGAKLAVNTVLFPLVAAITVIVAWLVGLLLAEGRDLVLQTGDDGVRQMIAACLLAGALVWFGFGIGLIVRSTPGAIAVVLLWPLLVEGLLQVLLMAVGASGAIKWLPYHAGFGSVIPSGPSSLGWPNGLIYFAGVALALVVLGAILDHRRDA